MIHQEETMLGNLLQGAGMDSRLFTVAVLDEQEMCLKVNFGTGQRKHRLNMLPEELKGLPLTPEVITKHFGFTVSDRNEKVYVSPFGLGFYVFYNEVPDTIMTEAGFYWGENFLFIRYAHQLQNLHFAILQKNLEAKL